MSSLSCSDQHDLDCLSELTEIEKLGKKMYESSPPQILQPIRSAEEWENAISLAEKYGMKLTKEDYQKSFRGAFFTPVSTECNAIQEIYNIHADIQPRYMGNALHMHDYFEIICVCRGEIQQIVYDTRFPMTEGDLLILCPGVPHDIMSFDSKNVVITIQIRRTTFNQTFSKLFSDGDVMYQYFQRILSGTNTEPYLLFKTSPDAQILSICLDIYREVTHPQDYSNPYLNLQMSTLFLRLLRMHCGHLTIGNREENSSESTALLILQYMHANYQTVTLESVSETFHYNSAYLSRMFKTHFGTTFHELRTEIRLAKAKELLESTELPISEISVRVGYDSESHFFRTFKSHFDVSPQDYRRNLNSRERKL